jgi:hypothetical protein
VCLCIAFCLLYRAIRLATSNIDSRDTMRNGESFISINEEIDFEPEEEKVVDMTEAQQNKYKCVFLMFTFSYGLRSLY